MIIPRDRKIYETPISTHWISDEGIVYGKAKPGPRTVDAYQELMETFKLLSEEIGKFCLLSDATDSPSIPIEAQKYFVNEFPKYVKAQAILTASSFNGSLVGTVIKLSWNGFPIMRFHNEEEAKKWLMEIE